MQQALKKVLVAALLSASWTWAIPNETAGRKGIDLWGEWHLLPVEGAVLTNATTVPEGVGDTNAGWLVYTAPAFWTDQKHDSAWLVRDIEISPEDVNKVFKFVFHGAYFYKKLFINGHPVAEHYGGEVPFSWTVPDGLFRAGKNQIALAMVNASVVRRDNKCIWKDGVGEGWLWGHPEHFMPCSMNQGRIGIYQPAELRILPRVYIEDVFVRTSTRRMHLDADVEVVNASDQPQMVYVRGRVLDLYDPSPETATNLAPEIRAAPADAKVAKKFWPIYQILQPGERRVITVGGSWCDRPLVGETGPRFWSPEYPKLYHFHTEISVVGEEGPALDSELTRFGFREVWIENGKVMLNGKVTFLGGSSFWEHGNLDTQNVFQGLKWHKYRLWMNAMRAHVNWWQKTTLQATDELGFLVLIQPPIAAGATTTLPDFWAHVKRMYLDYIKAYRNCPSIIIWSTDNESTFTSGMPDLWAPSIPALTDMMEAFRKLDPTRLVTSSHGYDLRGRGDFFDAGYNNHAYTTRFPSDMYQYKSWYFDFNQAWDRVKPILTDEWGEGFGADSASSAFGDLVYRPPLPYLEFQNIQDMRSLWVRYHQAWGQYMGLMETRKQGSVSCVMCFGDRMGYWNPEPDKFYNYVSLPEPVWDCAHKNYNSLGAYPSDLYRSYVAGRRMVRPYIIINESGTDLDGYLNWTLTEGDEIVGVTDSGPWHIATNRARRVASGSIPVRVRSGSRSTVEIAADLPRQNAPRAFNIRVELTRGTNVVYHDRQQYVMLPSSDLSDSPAFTLLGGAESAFFFKGRGARFVQVDSTAAAVAARKPIVVAVDARLTGADWKALESFVQEGGKLFVLARQGLPQFFLNVPLSNSGQDITFAHPRAHQHPVTRGLTAMTAFWWPEWKGDDLYDDFMVARDCLERPYQGNFRILMDSGIGYLDAGQGLSLAPMLEVLGGKGHAVFCSLMLQEKAEICPAAAFILKRAIDYLRIDGQPLRKVVNLGVDLSRIYADEAPANTPLDPARIAAVVVSGSNTPVPRAEEILRFAKDGGVVIVHNTRPDTAAEVGRAFGIEIRENVAPPLHVNYMKQFADYTQHGSWQIRWTDFNPVVSPLFDGMSHFDLNSTFSSGIGRFIEKNILADVSLACTGQGLIEAAKPGVIWLMPVGQGAVVFDQVLWDAPGKQAYCQARSDEYIAQLLSNAGVKLTPPTTSGGRIEEWLILGPFKIPNTGWAAQNHMELPDEKSYAAKEGLIYERRRDDGAIEKRTWMRGRLNVRAGAANNLNSYFGQPDWTRPTWDYYVAYLQAFIVSEEEQEVLICGGADDSLKLYLNGELVSTEENLGGLRNDEMVQAKVRLQKGPNRLFVKCGNWLGQWGFIVKVKDAKYPVSFRVE